MKIISAAPLKIAVAAAFLSVAGPALAADKCFSPEKWSTKADASRDQYNINNTAGRFLLEYTKAGDGPSGAEGAPFYATIKLPAGNYRLRTKVDTGNAQSDFIFTVLNATDENGGPISYQYKPEKNNKAINRIVRTTGDSVELKIRSETIGKTWSFVGPTSLCAVAG